MSIRILKIRKLKLILYVSSFQPMVKNESKSSQTQNDFSIRCFKKKH